MINHNSALSMSMNVSELVPKAATAAPARGDSAFGEALAGARGVIDRRESHEAAAPSRRDWAQGDRTGAKPVGQERAEAVRSDSADRAGRTEEADADAAPVAEDGTAAAAPTDDAEATPVATEGGDDAAAATDGEAATTTAITGEATTTTPTAATTVAVSAAPVADLDAIIVPTTTQAQATTDAVDAAIRMAITGTDAAATTEVDATVTATVTATADEATAAATIARGAEDAEDGDVQAGPTSPSASRPTTTSGPSPVQLAAATFTEAEATAAAPVSAPQVQVAQAATVQVAEGEGGDADAQLVQAAAVSTDDAATTADAGDAPAVVLKAKADVAATTTEAGVAGDVVEADVPEAVQAARLAQQQAPTVAANAQHQAAVQAKAAEKVAAEEGGEAAAPKLEPLPAQAAPIATTARTEGGIRVREGLLTAHQQLRIDHIAEQLATRLRLSQAAGGNQVQLSLKPRELGDVTVQMQVRDGIVAATVLVDRAETARTMQTNLEDLRRSLEQQGLSIQEFSVDVRGETGAGGADARAAADLRGRATGTSAGSTASVAGAAAVIPGLSGDDVVEAEDVHDGDVSVLA